MAWDGGLGEGGGGGQGVWECWDTKGSGEVVQKETWWSLNPSETY